MSQVQYIDSFAEVSKLLPTKNVLFLADQNTLACLNSLELPISESNILVSEPGESSKSLHVAELVWGKMAELNLSRSDYLVAVGGGVVTDLAAFCGSTFKRGINYIHVPTSLLAMVDASIGGKNGINFRGFKNYIGTFSEAESILICPKFLDSLPLDELRSGYGEMYKHALLGAENLWTSLLNNKSLEATPNLSDIKLAASFKERVVKEDFTEKNRRKLLNLGHTIGHAIESVCMESETPLKHGDAVIAGILIEALISVEQGKMKQKTLDLLFQNLMPLFPKATWRQDEVRDMIHFAKGDKKSDQSGINCTLLSELFQAEIDCLVREDEIELALNKYLDYVI